jgi:DNA mismatch endonuclease (patch repair protein)
MSKIKAKNTIPELIVRKYLHSKGLRFRLHVSSLPGKPDVVYQNTIQ